jgi:hypothetical protein
LDIYIGRSLSAQIYWHTSFDHLSMAENCFEPVNGFHVTEADKSEGRADGDSLNIDEDEGREADEHFDTRCGIGACRPSLLQRCNNPQVLLVCLCVYTLVHGKWLYKVYSLTHS